MKKVIIILLFLIVIGCGVGGTVYFYNQNKNQIAANEQLTAQNAQVQAQLNAIGAMVEVYEVSKDVYSGKEILDGDLVAVSVPASTLNNSSVTDKNLIVGKYYRIDIHPGTILSLDMLMDEEPSTVKKFPMEITLEALPVGTVTGDYIDIRFLLANGEEYPVLTHEKIQRITNNNIITLFVTEEEQALLISLFNDLGIYPSGCIAYATKYLEPGNNTSVAFYPIQHDMENFVRFNPNIVDPTRCINETLRDHIDEILLKWTDSENNANSSAFLAAIRGQIASQNSAQSQWVQGHTDENGNLIVNGVIVQSDITQAGTSSSSGTVDDGSGAQSFQQQVGEATEQLEQDLEAIQ